MGSKLKSALSSHQHQQAKAQAKSRAEAFYRAKEASTKQTVAERKALKRRRQREQLRDRLIQREEGEEDRPNVGVSKRLETTKNGESAKDGAINCTVKTSSSTSSSKSNTSTARHYNATIPISSTDTVLLLGEANFSFTYSLLFAHHHPPHQILSTSYDDESTCYSKYPDAQEIVQKIRGLGGRVEFGVDAGDLKSTCKGVKKFGKEAWSRVVFNFPHVGAGIKDQDRNILKNQQLILRTFRSVYPYLTRGPSSFPISHNPKRSQSQFHQLAPNRRRKQSPNSSDEDDEQVCSGFPDVTDDEDEKDDGMQDLELPSPRARFTPPSREGTLLITLLDQPPYTLWDIKHLASRPAPIALSDLPKSKSKSGAGKSRGVESEEEKQPRYRLLRSFEFVPAAWEGYSHRRTIGWREGLSKSSNEEIMGRSGKARTYEFAPLDKD